jgi:hypothetical protein
VRKHLSLRRLIITAVATTVAGLSAVSAASAATLSFTNWTTSGSLTVAKLHQSVKLPAGSTFNGSIDTTTGQLTGHVSIPPFTSRLTVLGVPVDATLQFVEAQPVSGTVTLGSPNSTVNASASAIIKITRLSSPLLPLLNLAGNSCQTSSPVVLPLNATGPTSQLLTGITFTGTTTIPLLQRCGLATPLLNLLMAGPNNPFSVSIAPPS